MIPQFGENSQRLSGCAPRVIVQGHPGGPPPFFFPPLYGIPFRTMYSRNISNLMMAGRNISVSHVALGTTRVMAACAVCAQAVGTAAALIKKYGCTPRDIYEQHMDELQVLLQKNDNAIPRRPVNIPDDLVQSAHLSGDPSMTMRMMPARTSESFLWEPKSGLDPCDVPPEDRRKGQYFILSGSELEAIELLIHNIASCPVSMSAHLRKEAFGEDIAAVSAAVPPGNDQVVTLKFGLKDLEAGRYILILDPAEELSFAASDIHLPGVERKADGCYHNFNNMVFNITPPQQPYALENLHNDYGRPVDGAANMWIAEAGFPRTVTLQWDQEVVFDRLDLVFDTNLDQYRFAEIPPECIKDFRVEYEKDGKRFLLLDEKDNFCRFRRFDLPQSITADKLYITLLSSNGDDFARLYGIHAYQK